jgi:hypothetical protein
MTDKTRAHMLEAGAIFGFSYFGFEILDFRLPAPWTHCLLLTVYSPFGISDAAEVMRVFQSEFFDANQKYD